jgi:hypothetical protein
MLVLGSSVGARGCYVNPTETWSDGYISLITVINRPHFYSRPCINLIVDP